MNNHFLLILVTQGACKLTGDSWRHKDNRPLFSTPKHQTKYYKWWTSLCATKYTKLQATA